MIKNRDIEIAIELNEHKVALKDHILRLKDNADFKAFYAELPALLKEANLNWAIQEDKSYQLIIQGILGIDLIIDKFIKDGTIAMKDLNELKDIDLLIDDNEEF